MRAIAVARVPVLLLSLVLVTTAFRYNVDVHVDGVIVGEVGPDGVDLCVDTAEDPAGMGMGVGGLCVRSSFCAGVGFDSMSQQVCPPLD